MRFARMDLRRHRPRLLMCWWRSAVPRPSCSIVHNRPFRQQHQLCCCCSSLLCCLLLFQKFCSIFSSAAVKFYLFVNQFSGLDFLLLAFLSLFVSNSHQIYKLEHVEHRTRISCFLLASFFTGFTEDEIRFLNKMPHIKWTHKWMDENWLLWRKGRTISPSAYAY